VAGWFKSALNPNNPHFRFHEPPPHSRLSSLLRFHAERFRDFPVSAAVIQPELISDDPRRDAESTGVLADLRAFVQASRELGGLLTSGQAAKILGVQSAAVGVWVRRGRLSARDVLGVQMVSAPEVLALHRQRFAEGVAPGGRGNKAPSLSVLAAEAWRDIDPLG